VGSREALRAEIDRLRLAASDMRQAAAGARHLEAVAGGSTARMNADAELALETGVIVSYARPFTRQGIGQLDRAAWAPDDEAKARLHASLIRLRNIRYAHTDKTDLRSTEDVFGEGRFSESWQPLAASAWPRIAELATVMEQGFADLARALEGVLRDLAEG
jgi:hypothetical protein